MGMTPWCRSNRLRIACVMKCRKEIFSGGAGMWIYQDRSIQTGPKKKRKQGHKMWYVVRKLNATGGVEAVGKKISHTFRKNNVLSARIRLTRIVVRLRCGQKWLIVGASRRKSGSRARFRGKSTTVSPSISNLHRNVRSGATDCAFHGTTLSEGRLVVWAMGQKRSNEFSWKPSGEGGREGSSENTRRVSRRLTDVRESVLYHQHYRGIGADLSDAGVDCD